MRSSKTHVAHKQNPAAKQTQVRTDATSASCSIIPLCTHDLTHGTGARRSPHCSRMLTSLPRPQKQEHSNPAHSTLCRATELLERACEMRNGPKPDSQITRTHHNTTHAASMGTAEAPSKRRRTFGEAVCKLPSTRLARFLFGLPVWVTRACV